MNSMQVSRAASSFFTGQVELTPLTRRKCVRVDSIIHFWIGAPSSHPYNESVPTVIRPSKTTVPASDRYAASLKRHPVKVRDCRAGTRGMTSR